MDSTTYKVTHALAGKNPETRAFANEYSSNIADDEEEFDFLRKGDDKMDIDGAASEGSGEEEGDDEQYQRPRVTAAQLRQDLLAVAQQGEKVGFRLLTTLTGH